MPVNLWFEEAAWQRLMLYVAKVDSEISGMGRIERRGDTFFCPEVVLLEQKVGGAHTDITSEGIAQFLATVMQDRPDTWGQWLLWWHSHVNMGANFSTQDEATLRMLCHANEEWFMGLVVNKKRESTLYVAVEQPIQLLGKLGEAMLYTDYGNLEGEVEAEIGALVHKPAPKPAVTHPRTLMPVGGALKRGEDAGDDGQFPFLDTGQAGSNGRTYHAPNHISQRQWKRMKRQRKHNDLPDDPDILEIISDRFQTCCTCGGGVAWTGGPNNAELLCVLCTHAVSYCGCPPDHNVNAIQQSMSRWVKETSLAVIRDAVEGAVNA